LYFQHRFLLVINMAKKKQYKPKQKIKKANTSKNKHSVKLNINQETDKVEEKISVSFKFFVALIIAILSFIAYIPSLDNEFTNWDDNSYAAQNYQLEDFNWKGVKKQFSQYWMGNYHPLAMLSLSVDFNLASKVKPSDPDNKHGYEPSPFVFHLHNLILHILNTLAVYVLALLIFRLYEQKFRKNKKSVYFPMAVLTGLLFGLNAMHVESIAWVSERKDVLYSFFFIVSLILYVLYLQKKEIKYYIFSIILFILSLLSKGQAVSLAVTLIAIDIFLGRDWKSTKIWIEKIPYLVLAFVFGVIAVLAQKSGAAIHDIADYYFHERIIWAAYGLFEYLWKLSLPIQLSPLYPYPYKSGELPVVYWLYLIPAIAILTGFYYTLKKNRIIAFGLGFFFINIFLLLQLLPVGSAVMADRYAYIPSIGYFLAISSLIPIIIDKKLNIKFLYVFFAVYLTFIGYLTYKQCDVWQDGMSLWNQTLKLQPKAVVAWNNRGSTKEKYKDHLSAIKDFDQAIYLKPDYTHAYYNRGTAKKSLAEESTDATRKKELLLDALDDFNKAIVLLPKFDQAYHNRGITYDNLGDFEKAMKDYNKAIEIKPQNADPYINRGVLYGKMGKLDSAILDFNYALTIRPNDASAYSNRGLAKSYKGDDVAALKDYNRAIELNPNHVTALSNRGIILKKNGKYQEALNDFTTVISINPQMSEAYYYRATVYILLKNYKPACIDLDYSYKLGFKPALKLIEQYCK